MSAETGHDGFDRMCAGAAEQVAEMRAAGHGVEAARLEAAIGDLRRKVAEHERAEAAS